MVVTEVADSDQAVGIIERGEKLGKPTLVLPTWAYSIVAAAAVATAIIIIKMVGVGGGPPIEARGGTAETRAADNTPLVSTTLRAFSDPVTAGEKILFLHGCIPTPIWDNRETLRCEGTYVWIPPYATTGKHKILSGNYTREVIIQ